jgi:RNA polymerase sigma factor (sigma-70 family)
MQRHHRLVEGFGSKAQVPWTRGRQKVFAAEGLGRTGVSPPSQGTCRAQHAAASAAGLAALVPALRQLSPAQRAAIVLHYEADLPVREVARRMGTSAGAVKVHLLRGRRRLRELLGDEEAGDA